MLPQLSASQAAAMPCENVADWWAHHRAIAAGHPDPILQAIVGGFVADRIGWAFASGYQAALRWRRDRELLKVAGSAREQRTKRAWERLRSGTAS